MTLPACVEFFLMDDKKIFIDNAKHKIDHVFCVTVFNEDFPLVTATIQSILRGVLQLQRQDIKIKSCICIVVDGIEHASGTLLDWFLVSGLMSNKRNILSGECDVYSTKKNYSWISEYIKINKGEVYFTDEIYIDFIVCLKHKNRGKLHSHAIFFRSICPQICPEFCYQVDAGTIIDIFAIAELVNLMHVNDNIAALAPCILVEQPVLSRQILSVWQYLDFILQKAVWWPFELSSGYLSVLPGQFCMFRWQSLVPNEVGVHDRAATYVGPINAYLRGLFADTPFDRLMFLAEDRVIGNEIILTPERRWVLDYAVAAQATTDTCRTFSELLRQRRRWNNSALACRLWLLSRWFGYMRRVDRTLSDKMAFSVALLAQMLVVLFDLTAPAALVCAIAFFLSVAGGLMTSNFILLKSVLGVTLALAVLLSGVRHHLNSRYVGHCAEGAFMAAAALLAATFVMSLPATCLLVICAPVLLSITAILSMNGHNKWRDLQLYNSYLLTSFAISAILSMYSMWKIDDISWGTKGLRAFSHSKSFHRRIWWLKFVVLLSWGALNGVLIFVGLTVHGFSSEHINIIFEMGCLGYSGIVATALVTRMRRWGKRFWGGRVPKTQMPVSRSIFGS